MIAEVPPKRRDGKSSFVKLVSYVTIRDDVEMGETLSPEKPFMRKPRSEEAIFNRLVEYATRNPGTESVDVISVFPDGRQRVLCGNVVTETNCFSLATSATEMNMVAMQNARCKDPVYHVILSWPESEKPGPDQIFDCARHSMKSLGMEGHQYVCAIHDDTDNLHCHLTVNRINPVSYRAASLYNDRLILDRCCREMELKYGWQHVNGPYMVNTENRIVRRKRFYKPAPAAAKGLEHFADRESLYSYAVDKCRDKLESLFSKTEYRWSDIHNVLHAAGLELRRKGPGLAIYDLNNDEQTPLRASRLHPELTLNAQQEYCGAFRPAPERRDDPRRLVTAHVNIDSLYDSLLHKRDRGARAERRIARAEAREDLKARYKAYKNSFVRPVIAKEDVRNRQKSLSMEFRVRKNNVRLTQRDPLLRKLMYRALEVERMKAMAALRLQVQEERNALKLSPASRCLTYRAWVEVQAAVHFDAAAVSQLRGWAYREKKGNRTKPISKNILVHAVADDVKPVPIRGYQTQIHRDGAVVYVSGDKPVLIDRGVFIEVGNAPEERGKPLEMALHISDMKSKERLEIRGEAGFVNGTHHAIKRFNQVSGKALYLTRVPGQESAIDSILRPGKPVPGHAEKYEPAANNPPAVKPQQKFTP